MSGLQSNLRELLRAHPDRVAFLVGPEVARQAVKGSPVEPFATREELVRDGIERASRLDLINARSIDPSPYTLFRAASDMKLAVSRWLKETVGSFTGHARDFAVLNAVAEVQRSGVMLATTNHDRLLENVTDLRPTTWRDPPSIHTGHPSILHLHGVWDQPDTVILSDKPPEGHDYVRTIRTLLSRETIVCVGYETVPQDSILGRFLRSLIQTANPAVRFFRLGWDDETKALSREYNQHPQVVVVPYGPSWADLAPYLRSLLPPPQSVASAAARDVPEPNTPDELAYEMSSPRIRRVPPIGANDDLREVVSTGVATMRTPEKPLPGTRSLQVGRSYYFWLEVGAPVAGSIEATPMSLPSSLPKECVLQVVLFTNPDSLEITGPALGELQLTAKGPATVHRPASVPEALLPGSRLRNSRLFFAVRTPAEPGVYALRIGIYHRRVLVQSRLVRLHVTPRPQARPTAALSSTIDYSVVREITLADTAALAPHSLSVLLNADDDDARTHSFRFLGEGDFHGSASLDAHLVQDAIRVAREALRQVAWGNAEPWDPRRGFVDRYAGPVDFEAFRRDLALLARAGFRLYDLFASRLRARGDLEAAVRKPGTIQFALKDGARAVFPVALIYDHPLDTGFPESQYVLCPAFCAAVGESEPLHTSACLRGECPHRDDPRMNVVCPGGFWGFRHMIGVQPGLEPGAAVAGFIDAIEFTAAPQMLTTVSTDPKLRLREVHLRNLYTLVPGQRVVESRDDSLTRMREDSPHIVYFYCHGGRTETGHLCLELGPTRGSSIARDTLRAYRVRWTDPRALVVLNGCHTVDVEPERAIEMVSGFLSTVGAAGVVGTEITVFEPLATKFAEGLLQELVNRRRPLGEAVRTTRHRLLSSALNPLGLVYIPFALASLRLVERAPT